MLEVKLQGVSILRISSVSEARMFYCNFLGFTVDWEHYYEEGAPVYMQVSRDGLILHLSQNERFKKSTIIYIGTKGIDGLRSDIVSRVGDWKTPSVTITAWQTKQMEIEDPFGNLLRFNEESR